MPNFKQMARMGLVTVMLAAGLVLVGTGSTAVEASWYADRIAQITGTSTSQPAATQPMQTTQTTQNAGTGSSVLPTYMLWRQRYSHLLQQETSPSPSTPSTGSGTSSATVNQPPPGTTGSTTQFAGTWNQQERQLLALVNERRQTPFQTDERLQAAAQARVEALLAYYLRHKNIPMDHFIPGQGYPTAVVREYNVQFIQGVGENIGAHRDIHRSNAALWASSGHRRNLEDASPWTHVGIGVRDIPGVNGVVVVQLFVRK